MASRALRPIRIEGNDAFITLTKGYVAVIDATAVPLVAGRNWSARVNLRRDGSLGAVYAQARIDGQLVAMHTLLLVLPSGVEVDHHDGDGLNNRKTNLRAALHAQNMHNSRIRCDNTSGFKGVCFDKRSNRWLASIRVQGRLVGLGLHVSKEAAAQAYAKASAKFHGEFGRIA